MTIRDPELQLISSPSAASTNANEANVPEVATPRISVRGLRKVYRTSRGDVVALENVSIDVAEGEMLVLLGPSGCGKTTLLRSVAGLERPDGGAINIRGETVFDAAQRRWVPPERRRLSMVFQSYALWPHMTVAQNISYPLESLKLSSDEMSARVERVLTMVGLKGYGSRFPGQLSGGEQQRIALARAIVASEGVVLFDEPLSNLDAKVRERLRIEILSLQREIGFTALYVTHDQAEAAALADRIAVMSAGSIEQIGAPTSVYHEPTSRYVAGFVGSVNEIQGTVADVSGDRCRVNTPIGSLVGRPMGADRLEAGSAVSIMFRPEHCRTADADPVGNQISGRHIRSVFLGAHVEHLIQTESGDVIVIRGDGSVMPAPDQAVTIQVDSQHVWVFRAS